MKVRRDRSCAWPGCSAVSAWRCLSGSGWQR